ncbi:PREDICTED: F-box/LRR-repeat [Prunus dulcis]|uniref:PREDICTED: F-box/LRR-repeat n=1 Tax=Prunus dulcis TaxID=3755 RepID=A0A5E4FDF6_PRUDU|nr:F-box/LRR-repeat protein At3g48880-like [Prunus dulcis]KAI5349812.1 hypothetical protein L3X38_002701 [Prunus dulcis]VVA25480.1 PREDICTED: F-box/LRR-repeat [Prunus dulcis]
MACLPASIFVGIPDPFAFHCLYLTFKMENERRWEDLNVDCLVNVFGRVGMQSLLLDVPFVCKSWYTASLSPSCWECLIFPGGFDGFDLPTHDLWSSEGELRNFMDRFRCIYRIDEDHFSLTAFLKVVVNRSRGHATVVRLPGFCSSEAMKYVADVCPRLKALYVDKMIPELIGKWKDLEELFLASSIGIEKTLSEIGIHCKNFWRLHVGNAYICNTETLAIVKLVPNIKHLSLRQADIERDNLVTILQGCKELVALDVSDCRGFDEGDDEIYKLASHITNFRCEGSSSKYSSDSDDNLDQNPVYFFGYESD